VLLRSLGIVVWLTAREDVLFQRVSRNRQRPLLHTADPRGTLRGLLAAREGFYRSCAHLTVDTSDETHAQVAHAVLRAAHAVLAARTTPAGAELAAP
jgi:shikimate kinase